MDESILKIGMPAGSLANPKRGGNLLKLLEDSGFRTSGYDLGGPSKFTTVNYLFGWDGRPQEFSSQLSVGELDVAIAGDDWIQERILELKMEYNTDIILERVMSLNRGGVKIVGIIDKENRAESIEEYLLSVSSHKDVIVLVSEMPYITLNWIIDKLKAMNLYEKYHDYSVQKYKTPALVKRGILIYETWGKTESKVKNKGADIGVEITQTGSAIKNYDLKVIDTIMNSQTSIWINPEVKSDVKKRELLEMFLLNLYGTLNAENKVLIIFNVPNENVKDIEKYLAENNLYADEPTTTIGKSFTVYNIQIDTANTQLPLARIRYELARRNAKNIDTLPLSSSIQSLESLDL